MKILIVDDSRVIRLANQSALNKAGHQTFSAGDGEEGLRLAREHRPDLIVLDMMLPKLSGPEVMRAAAGREHCGNSHHGAHQSSAKQRRKTEG